MGQREKPCDKKRAPFRQCLNGASVVSNQSSRSVPRSRFERTTVVVRPQERRLQTAKKVLPHCEKRLLTVCGGYPGLVLFAVFKRSCGARLLHLGELYAAELLFVLCHILL